MDCNAWCSTMKVNREALKEELEKSLTDPRLMLLESKDYDEMIDVFADAFLEDPLALYVSGLDGLEIDATKKKELQLKCNVHINGWVNRPILVRNKGVAVGIKDPVTSTLAGAMTLSPGSVKTNGFWDVVTTMFAVGAPPFYTKEKVNYGLHADKRLESLVDLTERKKQVMEDKEYIYVQTLGVKNIFQGKGYGGLLLRLLLDISRSMKVGLYLETESESNESLYKHFGFQTLETMELQGKDDTTNAKLKMWLMYRPADL